MKIRAPSLKLDMKLTDIEIRDGSPVIVSRVGIYDATTELSKEDIATVLRCIARPRVLSAFVKIALSRSASPKT